jgi:cell division protein FtsL
MILLYISNGLIYDLEIRRQSQLEEKLLRSKVKYNLKLQDFMEFNSYGKLLELSKKHGLNLEEPNNPPTKIEK